MSAYKLEQIFRSEHIWKNSVPEQLKAISENTYIPTYFSSQSRTLSTTLNRTFGWYNGGYNAFRTLYSFCSILKNNIKLKIYPKYLLLSSDVADDLTTNLNSYLSFPTVDAQYFNIVFYHVARGKSYIRPILDDTENGTRLKNIETFCIDNPQHFIRIYRNFNASGLNTLTIFSDHYTEAMLYTLWVMLPHLMEITQDTTIDTPENKLQNERIATLYEIFNIFYEILKTTNEAPYSTLELNTIQNKLHTLLKKYENQFDFLSNALNSFTKRLAHIKNTTAQEYFTKEMSRVTRSIDQYEQELINAYTKKQVLQRQLINVTNATEEDIKPFTETILNSKAIEILRSTDSEMVLRITAPLQYFQESDFEAYEKNPKSVYNIQFTSSILKRIFHKVFVTREYKILLQAIIHINIQTNYNDSPLRFYAEKPNYSPKLTQFPNPHLYHHDCWGAAKAEMHKNVCEGNYELVVMQMVAAVQTVNIAENASFVSGLLMDIKTVSSLRNLLTFVVNTPDQTLTLNYDEIIAYEQNLEKAEILKQAEKTITENTNTYTQIELPDQDDL